MRVENGANSSLLNQEPGTKLNRKGADPEVLKLVTLIGLYEKHCSGEFDSPNALKTHVSQILSGCGLSRSVKQVGNDINRFKKGVSGELNPRLWIDTDKRSLLAYNDYILGNYTSSVSKRHLEEQIIEVAGNVANLVPPKARSE